MKITETHFVLIMAETGSYYKKAYKLEDGTAILEFIGFKEPFDRISAEEFDALLANGVELDKDKPLVLPPITNPETGKYYIAECDSRTGYIMLLELFDLSKRYPFEGKYNSIETSFGFTNSTGNFSKLNRLATQEEIDKYTK